MMKRLAATLGLVWVASVGLYVGACGGQDHDDDVESGSDNATLADVVYRGGANDEALDVLLAATSSATPGPAVTWPRKGDVVPSATPFQFWWNLETTQLVVPSTARTSGIMFALRELGFGAERAAQAHGNPVNGKAYWLVFSTSANAQLLRVFTTEAQYQPDDDAWNKLRRAASPITLTVTAATYDNNNLAPNGGPFVGAATTFSLAP